MADLEHLPILTSEDEQPIALRRKRRSSAAPSSNGSSPLRANFRTSTKARQQYGISTPPSTPKRVKKRVRFSDPGPPIPSPSNSNSSGLTPFMRRTSLLSTPTSRRRNSTPVNLLQSNRAQYDAPLSGEIQFAPLRQVLDGRVTRRLRRNRLSEETNIIEIEKRHEARGRKREVERLREELAARDLEVQNMRDEQDIASQIEVESGFQVNTDTMQINRIRELERVIIQLRAELRSKEEDDDATIDDPNWTMAAKDPFDFEDEDENMITNYDLEFTYNDEMITTPTRLNTSFPSPPSTVPNTPSRSMNAGIQASPPVIDSEKELLREQLETLQAEVANLTSTIEFNQDHHLRLEQKLSEYLPADECHDDTSLDSALDGVLTQLALSQSLAIESKNAFSALGKEVNNLGFVSSGPEETLEIIARQFRQARLDLEYLTPGEIPEGFENHKLIEMLVSRIKVLVKKSKRNDERIDEYHEQEISLRQQLSTRIDIGESLNKELYLVNKEANDLKNELEQAEISNGRLQSALEGYRQEVANLEKLIEKVEAAGYEKEQSLQSELASVQEQLQKEVLGNYTTPQTHEDKNTILKELELRLSNALEAGRQIQDELAALSTSLAEKDQVIKTLELSASDREKTHGHALALRDARVSQLREEVQRITSSLETAESTIASLRKSNSELEAQVEGEKRRGTLFMQALREKMVSAAEISTGYLNEEISVQGPSAPVVAEQSSVVRPGLFDGSLARKGGKKKRRFDSGLGFLDEGEEEESVEI
ncbi:hypothetical protein HYFRA_00003055 [Hymenoscyphus fraxineus]|uniref:Uncharacterized protein n=1 Tax=Hymenoscyphus fraxineus TaxID=746836 RepID=A0A9N9KPR2_9HELO|nr:hypothetical protein HYFRA_00003055 [Hymenoscyphus fraxineus]